LAGTYFGGKWEDSSLFQDIVAQDTLDGYSDGVGLNGLAGETGFSAGWVDGGLGAAELDPRTVANVLGVWDAQDIVANDLDAIQQWNDTSGNNRHLVQNTEALRPVYRTGQMAGRPALRFTDRYFNVPDVSGSAEYEAFILVKIDNDPPLAIGQIGLWKFHPTGASNATNFTNHSDSRLYDNFASTTQKATLNPIATLTDWRVYNALSKAALWQCYIDGDQHFTTGTNTVNMPNAGCTLGFESYNAGALLLYLRGYIAFFAIFGRVLTAAEREGIHNFIAARKV
jgi:hypothetical protein